MPAGGANCKPAFAVATAGIAARAQVSGYMLSKILPLVVVVMVMLGAFHPAIDITAGERERSTLETTLSAPIDRASLMGGKVLAVATLASLTGVLNLASMSLTVLEGTHLIAGGAKAAIPWARAAAAFLVVPPTAFLFASVMVAIGALARSFKEAQTLLTPVYFLCMAPAMTAGLGDFQLSGVTAWIPGVGVTLLARDLILGHASLGVTLAVLVSTALYGAAALALAARLYDSERLFFTDEAGLGLGAWLRHVAGRDGSGADAAGEGADDEPTDSWARARPLRDRLRPPSLRVRSVANLAARPWAGAVRMGRARRPDLALRARTWTEAGAGHSRRRPVTDGGCRRRIDWSVRLAGGRPPGRVDPSGAQGGRRESAPRRRADRRRSRHAPHAVPDGADAGDLRRGALPRPHPARPPDATLAGRRRNPDRAALRHLPPRSLAPPADGNSRRGALGDRAGQRFDHSGDGGALREQRLPHPSGAPARRRHRCAPDEHEASPRHARCCRPRRSGFA